MIPTVGFNMRKITKGNVTIKVRAAEDHVCLGGQPRPLGRASQGGQSGILLLGSWEKRTKELDAGGLGERETRREKKRVPHRAAGTAEGKLGR